MNNKFENITLEDLYCKCESLNDKQKEKVTELCDKGWFDVIEAYWNYCKKRNYAMFLLSKEKIQIYKNNEHMTKEQKKKWNKLIEMGWKDVARAYMKTCEEENYTEVYRAAVRYHYVEDYGMDYKEL